MVGGNFGYPHDTDDWSIDSEKKDDERWVKVTCKNGHVKEIDDPSQDIDFYCPECGSRRMVHTNTKKPENTKSDKA